MAIYNGWGNIVTVKADCGEHKQGKRYAHSLILATHEDGKEAFYFDYTLKADGGIQEIVRATKAANKLALSKNTLKQAIKEAL